MYDFWEISQVEIFMKFREFARNLRNSWKFLPANFYLRNFLLAKISAFKVDKMQQRELSFNVLRNIGKIPISQGQLKFSKWHPMKERIFRPRILRQRDTWLKLDLSPLNLLLTRTNFSKRRKCRMTSCLSNQSKSSSESTPRWSSEQKLDEMESNKFFDIVLQKCKLHNGPLTSVE